MFSDMKPAERKLLEACQKGEFLFLGEERPREKIAENEIRGEFLRALILSNNQEIEVDREKYILKIDSKGIMFSGAYVSGEFDFSFCSTDLIFLFGNSVFEREIKLYDSKIKFLNLQGTKVFGIDAQRFVCESQVFLRKGFESNGEVNFNSTQIGGDFDCSNGKFYNENGYALNCEKFKIDGSIYFSDGFEAKGNVNLLLSQIHYNLDCSNGKFYNKNGYALICSNTKIKGGVFFRKSEFNGEINFILSQIGSNFECINSIFDNDNKVTINCDKALINGSFYLWSVEVKGNINFDSLNIDNTLSITNLNLIGSLILNSSRIKEIIINDNFWENKGFNKLFLDGLEYHHLSGINLDSKLLINLLEKMPEFKSQPYRQLVKVLRNNGDNIYADDVMIKYNDIQTSKNNFILKFFKTIYKFTTGYGYRPKNMLCTLIIVWLFFGWIYQKTAEMAVFAPSNPLIFQKKDFYQCLIDENGTSFSDLFNQKEYNEQNNWTKSKKLEGEYTTFQPYIYSLDLILPVVDLQMNKDWGVFISPINSKFTLNDLIRWIVWIEIIIGWTLGYILLSYLSGIISKRD